MTTADLFSQVQFPVEPFKRAQVMGRAFEQGWLISTPRRIDIGISARKHFDSLVQDAPEPSAKEKYVGIPAAPRVPLMPLYEGQLSAKYRVSSAGFRDDVPAFSVRDKASPRIAPMGSKPV